LSSESFVRLVARRRQANDKTCQFATALSTCEHARTKQACNSDKPPRDLFSYGPDSRIIKRNQSQWQNKVNLFLSEIIFDVRLFEVADTLKMPAMSACVGLQNKCVIFTQI
jgi:hypothetical protein